MSVEYSYLSTAFPTEVFNEDSLKIEISANESITTALDYIRSHEDTEAGTTTVYFGFATALSQDEQTALDGVVAAHQGNPPLQVTWLASSVLTDSEKAATDVDPAWTELGGAVTTPDFFTPNIQNCKGRIVGKVKTNGAGAKLHLREDDTTPSGGYDVPDTGGEWANMQWFSPDAPTAGTHEYILEGQLPASGATVLSVKYVAVSLLEFHT
jgi:hypothetical protein